MSPEAINNTAKAIYNVNSCERPLDAVFDPKATVTELFLNKYIHTYRYVCKTHYNSFISHYIFSWNKKSVC